MWTCSNCATSLRPKPFEGLNLFEKMNLNHDPYESNNLESSIEDSNFDKKKALNIFELTDLNPCPYYLF
ncbi:MAG: hypothetical protein ACTSWN_11305 [Promethearchaeota archaeon]